MLYMRHSIVNEIFTIERASARVRESRKEWKKLRSQARNAAKVSCSMLILCYRARDKCNVKKQPNFNDRNTMCTFCIFYIVGLVGDFVLLLRTDVQFDSSSFNILINIQPLLRSIEDIFFKYSHTPAWVGCKCVLMISPD